VVGRRKRVRKRVGHAHATSHRTAKYGMTHISLSYLLINSRKMSTWNCGQSAKAGG
jgi:hypothetical protein